MRQGITIIAVSVLLFIALVLINSTLMAYVRVALFRYATSQALPGFDTSNLDQAFITSKVSRYVLGASN